MDGTLKILFVEDVLRDAELNWREIEKNGIVFKKLLVDNKKDFLEELKSFKPDIIISDYSLPQFDGMQALLLRNELAPQTPFIIVTGSVNEEVAVECMKAGADDYVIKEHLARLPFAIKEALEQHILQIEKKAAELLLKESEEKIQSIFSAAPVGIGLVVNRVLIEVNDTFCKMTGYSHEELIGKSSELIYATKEEYESAGFEKYRQISEKGTGSVETRFKCKNGKILNILLSSAPLDKNDLTKGVTFTAMDITDRIHAEEELHIALAKYKTLFECFPLGITVSDEMGNILETNPTAEKLLGLQQSEQVQRDIDSPEWRIVRPDGTPMPPEEYASVQALKQKCKVENVEMGIVRPDNSITWINVTATPLPLEGYGVVITYSDITGRKRADEIIIGERRMLRTLIDSLPNQIYVKDFDCKKVIANKADFSNIGCKEEAEVLGKTDIVLFPGQTGLRGYDDDKQVISTGNGIFNREEDFVDSKGVRRWLLTTKVPLHDKEGKITGLVGSGLDITERKLAETELLHSLEFRESLLKTIPFGMDIVEETGTILFQSENFKRLFREDPIGKKCWEIYRDDKKQCSDCPLFKGITIGETEVYETHGVLGNRTFEISHTGMIYNGKKAMLEIFQDVTQKKIIGEELLKAKEKAEESDRLKTSFLHNISHEIRTPMNAIIGFSGFLIDTDLDPEKRSYFSNIIKQSCDQLLSIISDIVSIATIEAGQEKIIEKEFNLSSLFLLLQAQFMEKAKMQNIRLNIKPCLNENGGTILCDETKLVQILSNLIGNAIKFTNQGSVNFGCNVKGKVLEFFIEDTGIGIAPEMHEVIFNRFRQVESSSVRQFGGSGLGLSISKAFVELLGGEIRLISELGKGSTFFFTIPYKKSEQKTLPEIQPKSNIKIEGGIIKTILIAEDEDSNFMLLEEMLSGLNAGIIRATNGLKAVEICKSNEFIESVLMDIKMPIMDGYEATRQIRKFRPGLTIIAQTAYTSENDKNKAIECGCNDFITKPINKELLISKIYEHLQKSINS